MNKEQQKIKHDNDKKENNMPKNEHNAKNIGPSSKKIGYNGNKERMKGMNEKPRHELRHKLSMLNYYSNLSPDVHLSKFLQHPLLSVSSTH